MPTPPAAVPYSLAPHRFPGRALAEQAGRAAVGGQREVALACLVAVRLAAAMIPPMLLPASARARRAVAARQWLSSLTLPAGLRTPLSRLVAATGSAPAPADVAAPLRALADAAARHLDARSRAEIDRLAAALVDAAAS
ncbi:MAG TPA: hypothetical protein VFK13_12985 [Gemmatimonadaceae bacterium]|nr:hypothetical protein [Gemmatimonadaceae bacterium]